MNKLVLLTALVLVAPFAFVAPAAANGPATLRVPAEYASIQAAVDAANPGDTVLIAPGTYQEEVFVTTPGITIAGEDRVGVVLDGGSFLGTGITVTADDVVVRTLTAQNYVSNGVMFSRVTGFTMTDIHAIANGAYGLYAIHSTKGDISYSWGEGHGDSAFYIGETFNCDCDVHHNVGWNNMLGYSGTANSYVRIWANEFYDNRAGILMSVLPQEMGYDTEEGAFYGTQVGTEIYGNYVHHNNNKDAPDIGIWETVHPPVGEGITIGGGWQNHVHDNLLIGNALWGVGVFWLFTPPRGNVIEDNTIEDSRYGIWWDEWGEDNCFEGNTMSGVEIASDPDPLPTCDSLIAPLPCPENDWAACRLSDARAPSATKEADLAYRAVHDSDPHEDLI